MTVQNLGFRIVLGLYLEVDTGVLAKGVRVDVHGQLVAHIHGGHVTQGCDHSGA